MECNHNEKYAKNMCKECYYKEWYLKNKLLEKERGARNYKANKKKRLKQGKQWRSDNKVKLKKYYTDKLKSDPQYKLKQILRSSLNRVLKRKQKPKTGSAVKDLGCSMTDFICHLEAKFHCHPITGKQMTWENYGEWELDHIQELDTFDLSIRDQLLVACNYMNIQPLWYEEHLIKTAEYMRNKFFV